MDKKWIRKIIIIVGWLAVWQLVSVLVGNNILLVGPIETLLTLCETLLEAAFWKACIYSVFRIAGGFLAGMLLGIALAVLSARYTIVEEILSPVMALLKAVPVASFVVLFLIWWSSAYLAVAISFCIVLPNLYINTLEGMKSTDKKLLEMAKVFCISKKDSFFYIYRPALKPFWDSGIRLAAGMSWKSGVAAEVIGLPQYAIGERLYMSKIYLDTAGVLAWTVAIVCLSIGFEKLVLKLWQKFGQWEPKCKGTMLKHAMQKQAIELIQIEKSYHGQKVLDDWSAKYYPGNKYHFHTPSGSGKTTLFRIIAGLEQPDQGKVERNEQSVAFLFQEDRLCEEYSALKNVELVIGDVKKAESYLMWFLDAEDLRKPCKELSGGMKRRVAIARTLAAEADVLLLDEPYNGLDEGNREKVRALIDTCAGDDIVLVATHIEQAG